MMRVKALASLLLLAKVKLLWERVSFNKLTLFYFAFSVIHCIIQIVLQVQAFTINAQAESFLQSIISQGNATETGFPVFGSDLRWCSSVPADTSATSCQVIWNGQTTSSSSAASPTITTANPALQAAFSSSASSSSSSVLSSVTPSSSVSFMHSSSSVSVTSSTAMASSTASGISKEVVSSSSVANVTRITLVPSSVTGSNSIEVTATVHSVLPGAVVHTKVPYDDVEIEEDEDDVKYHALNKRDLFGTIQAIQVNGSVSVKIHGLGNVDRTVELGRSCLVSLNWPVLELADTKREDVTFIAFQIWVLGMSIVALLNESIPHIIASLLTHALATAWAGFAVSNTTMFHNQFNRLTQDGPCHQPSLLPTYWKARGDAEIPGLALNAAALLVSSFLSWRLIRLFGWQTFKRVGASFIINRVYKFVLSLTIVIQLSLFFIVASLGLWLDQLWNGMIGQLTDDVLRFKVIVLVVFIMLLPWLAMGWFAVRRELKVFMLVFIALSFLYIVGWAVMFVSHTFRWTFIQWPFFGVITSASVFLTLMTFVLGVICRFNFGKGLPRYLNAEEPLPGDDFVPVTPGGGEKGDEEKTQFPGQNLPVPTFSAAFGSGSEVPPPSQMFAPRQMGPRFYAQQANNPFEGEASIQAPFAAYTRSGSTASSTYYSHGTTLTRHDSLGSERSYSSQSSGHGSDRMLNGKRWLIE